MAEWREFERHHSNWCAHLPESFRTLYTPFDIWSAPNSCWILCSFHKCPSAVSGVWSNRKLLAWVMCLCLIWLYPLLINGCWDDINTSFLLYFWLTGRRWWKCTRAGEVRGIWMLVPSTFSSREVGFNTFMDTFRAHTHTHTHTPFTIVTGTFLTLYACTCEHRQNIKMHVYERQFARGVNESAMK